jgi:hypothetical protein
MLTALLAGLPALLSFLGGATARAVIGHVIKWFEQKQTHMQEMEKLRLQAELDQAAHVRQQDLIKLQSDLKLGEIKLVGENAIGLAEANAFTEAMKVANTPTGNWFIDAWNGSIRPAAGTIAITIWLLKIIKAGFTVTSWDENLVASILGYYFADRQLGKKNR